jgi:hypothetical protein
MHPNADDAENQSMHASKEQPAKFSEVDLTAANIKGFFDVSRALVRGRLNMNRLVVGQDLVIRGNGDKPGWFADIDLTATAVKGELNLEGARVGTLNMTGLEVGKDLM